MKCLYLLLTSIRRANFDMSTKQTLEYYEVARKDGWELADDPRHTTSFKKNNEMIWLIGRSYPDIKFRYVRAKIIDNHFTEHVVFKNCLDAIENKNGILRTQENKYSWPWIPFDDK